MMVNRSDQPDSLPGDDKSEAEMAVLIKLFARVPAALAINGICSLGTAAVLRSETTITALLAWLAAMAGVIIYRHATWRRFQHRASGSAKVHIWRRRFTTGAAASGLVWGLTSVVFYSAEPGPAQTFLPFILAGMIGGSLVILTGSVQASSSFLIAATAPYIAYFVVLGGDTYLIMAGLIGVYVAGLIALARPMGQSLVSSVHLAAMNERLITQLKEKSSQLQATFDHVNQGVAVFDHLGRLLTWNPRHRELHGYPIHFYRPGTHIRQFLDQDLLHAEQVDGGELDPKALKEPLAPTRYQQIGAEGRAIEVERSPMPGGGFVSTSTDITDHKRVEARMLHLAQHDPLTDLPNRLLFQDRLQQAMMRSTRSESPVGVIVMDLDGFKAINDAGGHRMGDEALKALARRLRSNLRESDTVARIGGDEFAIILPDLTTSTAALRIGEKILANIETPLKVEDRYIDLRVSLGIALFPNDASDADTLMQYADLAMYRAKRSGGSGISLARSMARRQRPADGAGKRSPSRAVGS